MPAKKRSFKKKNLDMASHDLKFRTLGMSDRIRRIAVRIFIVFVVVAALVYTAIMLAK